MTEKVGVSDIVQRSAIDGNTIITVTAIILLSTLAIAYMWSPASLQERERLYMSGFNAGWLNAQDCIAWAVEEGAQDWPEAFYWANYYCPLDESEALV